MFGITLLPIILLICLGFVLKRASFVPDEFWRGTDKMIYYVFFPALLIYKISSMSLDNVPLFEISSSILILLFLLTLTVCFVQKIKPISAASFTSVFQGSIRYNTFIALAFIDLLFTDTNAIYVAALIVGIKTLFINLLCVAIFSFYLNKSGSLLTKITHVFKNPLVVGCLVGLGLNFMSISLPAPVMSVLDLLSRAALTLGVLSVGAGLIIRLGDFISWPVIFSSLMKLVFFPLMAYCIGLLFNLDVISHQVLVIMFSMPTAINSYILAGQLGGDQPLMAKIIAIQTIASLLSLSIILQWIA